jgi:hypothetical protein
MPLKSMLLEELSFVREELRDPNTIKSNESKDTGAMSMMYTWHGVEFGFTQML